MDRFINRAIEPWVNQYLKPNKAVLLVGEGVLERRNLLRSSWGMLMNPICY